MLSKYARSFRARSFHAGTCEQATIKSLYWAIVPGSPLKMSLIMRDNATQWIDSLYSESQLSV